MYNTNALHLYRILLFLLAALFSCNAPASKILFHTEMGDMTIALFPHLPDPVNATIEQLSLANQDSLSIEKVLQNGFIQLNVEVPMPEINAGKDQAPTSGTFLLHNGRFYIVQGREHSDDTLGKWEQSTGRKISKEFRERYKKHGGALQLEGKCFVLGKLVSGKATLDRIAAIPNDADGHPLRSVALHLEVLK